MGTLNMSNNWPELLLNNRESSKHLRHAAPGLIDAFVGLNTAQGSNGALDAGTRELIALAVAVTTRCEGCIASHAKAARAAGVSEAQLSDALGTAIALNAGAAYTYSVKAMEAFAQFAEE
jgi:AhpD family alkylhydroperoxidase